MVIHDQDLDVVQWGLSLFGGDPDSGYCCNLAEHDTNIYGQYFRDHYETECSVENDERIAHVLQEEFSQLAITEASESSRAGEEHMQASIFPQDWLPLPAGNYRSAHEDDREEVDHIVPSGSCSSPEERSCDGEEYSYSLEITDESALDGEVGKRLNQIIPAAHVPRINGEIPSVDEATSDHQRLLDRLQHFGLVEFKVEGDGNCQFRALSDQFYRTPEHHKFVRRQVVNQLKSHPDIYEGYVPMAYDDYLKKMSRSGEWGDHVTLQAAADSYGVKIIIFTSYKDSSNIEILPKAPKSNRVIYLSFWAEVHYNSIYPQEGREESLSYESKKKKKWWIFGNKH